MIEPDLANIWEILDTMPFKPPPASEQGPLTFGERLCDLPFLDNRGRPLSLYATRFFGWPPLVHLAATAESAAPRRLKWIPLADIPRLASSLRDGHLRVLAWRAWHGRENHLPQTTGAKNICRPGSITYP